MSDEELAPKLTQLSSAFPAPAPRIEDHVMIFHADCGGIVVGELGKPLKCAECGQQMTAFISAAQESRLRQLARGARGAAMTRIREHRGQLDDSMATVRAFSGTRAELCEVIRASLEPFCRKFTDEQLKVEPYHYDARIDWDTYLISIEGYGVWGMADGPLREDDKLQA
jgi:hypothetical protein